MEECEKEHGADKNNNEKGIQEEVKKETGKNGDKTEGSSSDEDGITVTIGIIKTQRDIVQSLSTPQAVRFQEKPPLSTALKDKKITVPNEVKFQPKATPTSGLKDEDFKTPGKVNGIPITDFSYDMEDKPWTKLGEEISDYFNYGFKEESWFKYCDNQKKILLASETGLSDPGVGVTSAKKDLTLLDFMHNDMEDQPWRKPGADLSDYFNYGFNEDTWIKYCEHQRRMRIKESGVGLNGLGVAITKPFVRIRSTNVPVAVANNNSSHPKVGPPSRTISKQGQTEMSYSKTKTIQSTGASSRLFSKPGHFDENSTHQHNTGFANYGFRRP